MLTATGDFAIDRRSTTDQVAGSLRRQLFDGHLTPGTPLREVDLATAFGVSRSTVREALRTLVAEGLLTRAPNRGVVVRVVSPVELEDLQRARHVLETGAVSAARPAQLSALSDALASYEAAVGTGAPEAVHAAHIAFHQAVVGLAGSDRLSRLGAALLSDLRLALAAADRAADDAAHQLVEHRHLHDLIAAGDTVAALEELSRHLHQDHAAAPGMPPG